MIDPRDIQLYYNFYYGKSILEIAPCNNPSHEPIHCTKYFFHLSAKHIVHPPAGDLDRSERQMGEAGQSFHLRKSSLSTDCRLGPQRFGLIVSSWLWNLTTRIS